MKITSKIGMHQESTSLGGEIMSYFILLINATKLEPCIKGSASLMDNMGPSVLCSINYTAHLETFFLKFHE